MAPVANTCPVSLPGKGKCCFVIILTLQLNLFPHQVAILTSSTLWHCTLPPQRSSAPSWTDMYLSTNSGERRRLWTSASAHSSAHLTCEPSAVVLTTSSTFQTLYLWQEKTSSHTLSDRLGCPYMNTCFLFLLLIGGWKYRKANQGDSCSTKCNEPR